MTAHAVAQLRHLYAQMLDASQPWTPAQAANAARHLLGPAIEELETADAPPPEPGALTALGMPVVAHPKAQPGELLMVATVKSEDGKPAISAARAVNVGPGALSEEESVSERYETERSTRCAGVVWTNEGRAFVDEILFTLEAFEVEIDRLRASPPAREPATVDGLLRRVLAVASPTIIHSCIDSIVSEREPPAREGQGAGMLRLGDDCGTYVAARTKGDE